MKVLRNALVLTVLVLGTVMMVSNKAEAYSYNAWVGLTGDKTIAINPFMYGNITPGPFSAAFENVIGIGIGSMMDFMISIGATPWGMLRFGLGDPNQIVAIKATAGFGDTNSGTGTFGPHYHGTFTLSESFLLEANIWADLSYKKIGNMTFTAVIAPVVKFDKDASVAAFLEIDPILAVVDGTSAFSMNIVPGLAFMNGTFSIGVSINNVTGTNITLGYGAWIWVPFTL